jgi:DNA-binding MurR/RpiR family transcriptional regulator
MRRTAASVTASSRAAREAGQAAGSAPAIRQDIFSHISALEPQLSRSHKIVARSVLTRPQDFIEKPIEELVPWLGVSAPTVIRFCRAVGCEGLRDLKLKVMGGLRVGLRYFEPLMPPDGTGDVIERVMRRAHHAMATAVQTMDSAALERAAGIIRHADTLYAFGSGGVSSWLIAEVQNRLFRLAVPVVPCADHQMQMMLAAAAKRSDAVLCCSLTGRNVELVRVAAIARQYGAATLALTTRNSPLAAAVDLPLTLMLNDDRDVFGPTSMRYGFLVAVDVLSYLVALGGERAVQDTLRRIKQQFLVHRDEDDRQPLCD